MLMFTFAPSFKSKAALARQIVCKPEVEVRDTKLKRVGVEQRTVFSDDG